MPSLALAVEVGDRASHFEAESTKGPIRLADYQGKQNVVLAFQSDLSDFEGFYTQVMGVSSDSLETHTEFSRKHDITFALIADDVGDLRKQYGRGRVTFLIDKHGMVRYIQKGVPRNHDFLREIRKLNGNSDP